MGIIADALKGGGSFLEFSETPGTTYTGVITDVTLRQARKFESTEPDSWDDGTRRWRSSCRWRPTTGMPATPTTAVSDSSPSSWSGPKKALIAACKAAGVAEPEVGQSFTVTHVSGVGSAKSPRVFTYELKAGPSGVAAALTEPAAEAPTNPVDIAKTLLAAGLSPAEVSKASGLPEATVAALKNTLAA